MKLPDETRKPIEPDALLGLFTMLQGLQKDVTTHAVEMGKVQVLLQEQARVLADNAKEIEIVLRIFRGDEVRSGWQTRMVLMEESLKKIEGSVVGRSTEDLKGKWALVGIALTAVFSLIGTLVLAFLRR